MRREIGVKTLDQAKQAALVAIDTAAGQARSRYTTNEPGQEALYAIKRSEAEKKLGGMMTGGTPYLDAEAKALSMTTRELAKIVKARAQHNDAAYIAIERVRMPAKIAIRAAQTMQSVVTQRQQAITALNAV